MWSHCTRWPNCWGTDSSGTAGIAGPFVWLARSPAKIQRHLCASEQLRRQKAATMANCAPGGSHGSVGRQLHDRLSVVRRLQSRTRASPVDRSTDQPGLAATSLPLPFPRLRMAGQPIRQGPPVARRHAAATGAAGRADRLEGIRATTRRSSACFAGEPAVRPVPAVSAVLGLHSPRLIRQRRRPSAPTAAGMCATAPTAPASPANLTFDGRS